MTMQVRQEAKQIKKSDSDIEIMKSGAKRSVIQIQKTIQFELQKNLSKLYSMVLTSLGIFILFLIIELVQEYQGTSSPDDPIDYFANYLAMIDFLILIIASTFGGGIIAEDFEKETGNLIFPKIQKNRLLAGRVIARYFYTAISVVSFYVLIGITTWIKYETLPTIVWESMGWALYYTFAVFSLMILFSSIMKRASTATIVGILSVLIIFQLLTMILMFTGVTIEPLFILTYYGNIITKWLNMPEERFMEMNFRGPGGGNTYLSWATPSATGAIAGMAIYAIICLAIAYFVYNRRQD